MMKNCQQKPSNKHDDQLSTKIIKNDDLNSQESGYVVGQWISVRTI
jgi:hypothetical protein